MPKAVKKVSSSAQARKATSKSASAKSAPVKSVKSAVRSKIAKSASSKVVGAAKVKSSAKALSKAKSIVSASVAMGSSVEVRSIEANSAEMKVVEASVSTAGSVPTPRNSLGLSSGSATAEKVKKPVSRGFSLSSSKFSFRKNGATESVKISTEKVEFQVGDNAVYPGHGVGTVVAIESKEISGKKLEFYVVKMKETGMRVLVPKGNTSSVGLRPIISRTEAEKVMSILKDHPVKMDHQTWNRRYREYMEKIRTGSIYEIAEVLRALVVLRGDKELSYGERNMLESARKLLMVELSLAVEKSELESRPEMREMLGL